MGKVAYALTNFSGGEVGTRFQGRIDTERHPTGLAKCENWIVPLQGCAYRRPGTKFIAHAGDPTSASCLVPFEFSTTQAYVIEFGHLFLRFFKDGAQINAARTITAITRANPAVVTSTNHEFVNGQIVDIDNVLGMTEINGRTATVANATANTFELLGVNSTSFTAYTSGGTATGIYEIPSPYDESDLFEIQYCQSLDVLFVVHPGYAPRKLTRTAHDRWTITEIDFQDGPFLDQNTDTTKTIRPSGTTGAITLTAVGHTPFSANMVGSLVRIKHGSVSGCAKITGFTSSTVVNATVQTAFPFSATTASSSWRLGAWSVANGFPACVVFFQDRLVFGGPLSFPLRVDLSVRGDYELFSPTTVTSGADAVLDSSAIAVELNANDVQDIRWISPDAKGMLIGTGTGEWVLKSSVDGQLVTPSNATANQEGADGSARLSPVRVGKSTLFLQRAGRKIKEIQFYFDQDGFRSEDLTYIADHVTQSGIRQMTFQREPDPIVWCVREDGQLAAMTYARALDSLRVAWVRKILGGVSTAAGAPARVESATVIPGADGSYELWLSVQRHVNGATSRMIERTVPTFESEDEQHNAFFVDAGVERDGAFNIADVDTGEDASILTETAHGLANGDTIFVVELEGAEELNSKVLTVENVTATVTFNTTTDEVTWTDHPFQSGDEVSFTTTGTLPTGLVAGTTYFVNFPAANTFTLSATSSGPIINLTGSPSGTHTGISKKRIPLLADEVAELLGEGQDELTPYKSGGRLAKRVSTFSGLDHLIGETVQVLADGGVQEAVVSNDGTGSITLSPPAGFIIAGLGYRSDLQTLRFEAGNPNGAALGLKQRINFLDLFVDRTGGLKVGRSFEDDELAEVAFRDTGDAMGVAPPLFSGILPCSDAFDPDWSTDARVCIRQDQPLPATILAILPEITTEDRG